MGRTSLISLNVRGLGNCVKRRAIFNWLQNKKPDVVFLQETYTSVLSEQTWNREWSGPVFYSHGSSNSRGCAILISSNVDFRIKSVTADDLGRYLIVKCYINDEYLTLINVYAPNNEVEQLAFLEKLENTLDLLSVTQADDLIFGGDWNVVRDITIDKSGGTLTPKQHMLDKIEQLLYNFNLCDVWRIKNPNIRRYTWRKKLPELIQCRLDFWLISTSLYDDVTECDILPSIRSDHSAITLNFEKIPRENTKLNLWKFNKTLLIDENYVSDMKHNLQLWKTEYAHEDKRVHWELLKYKIRQFTIKYSKQKKRETTTRRKELEHELIYLEQNLSVADNIIRYDSIKQEIQQIEDKEIEGIIIRSKVNWYEHGEKSTKYFLGLEKSKAINKHVKKLETNNSTITNPDDILNEEVKYYKNLYSAKKCKNNTSSYETFQNIPKLNESDRSMCDGKVTIEECKNVVLSLKNNRSPGNDGLINEFYKIFWNDLKEPLVEGFNFSYDKRELSHSQRQSVITLIHKKDKDRLKLENWRPISLLNTDYKIVTKVIANRLKQVVPKLISITQTGFVKDRFMSDSVRTLCDLIEYCKLYNKEGILLLVDFQKAFDSLDWDFLFNTLKHMNFGQSFIQWITLFYSKIESCILNNGRTSAYFPVSRGVRQGDPLSPYLFILAMEVLTSRLLHNKDIKGITVRKSEIKLIQYADDMTAVLQDENSLRSLLHEMKTFATISGLAINISKTKALILGSNDNHRFKLPSGVKWTDEPIKVLGVYIGRNLADCYDKILVEKIDAMRKVIYSWKHRKLTLTGKITVLKSLVLSKINYLLNLIPILDEFIRTIDEMIFEYLWNGKTHKIKKSLVVQSFEHGGHKMIDINTVRIVQKLKWIKLYLNNHDCQWLALMEQLIKVNNLNLFLLCNFDRPQNWSESKFYKEILHVIHNLNDKNMNCKKENLMNQYVHYNKHIKIHNEIIYDIQLLNVGIWKASDLFDTCNNLIPFKTLEERGLPKSKFMLWHGLVRAIKKARKVIQTMNNVSNENHSIILSTNENIEILTFTTRDAYDKIVKLKYELPQSIKKYAITFPVLNEISLKNVYTISRVCTTDTYLKDLQFQILHRYLPTNFILYKMKKIPSMSCTFCRMHIETIPHLFYQCNIVRQIWLRVCTVLEKLFSIQIVLRCQDVIFGYGFEQSISKEKVLINNIILNVKGFIWERRKTLGDITYSLMTNWFAKKSCLDNSLLEFTEELKRFGTPT